MTGRMVSEPSCRAARSDATVGHVACDHVPVCRAARSDVTVGHVSCARV